MTDPADRVAAVGRYYLVRALFDSDKHDQVVQQASLMTEILKSDDLAEMRGALALAAISSLELKQYENVLKFADEFLPLAKDASKKSRHHRHASRRTQSSESIPGGH